MEKPGLNIEHRLLCQFKSGNEFAFELIFHRSKGKVKGFLSKVLPSGEDVESALQEVYIKLWLSRGAINTSRNFETYLFTIARNLVVDILRKKLHKQKYLEDLCCRFDEKQENSFDTLGQVEYAELEKRVSDLINKLPEKRREIFRLNRIDGFKYKEIAARLNISENTVDSQMRKAKAFINAEMKHFLALFLFLF